MTSKGPTKIFYCFSDRLYKPQSRDLKFCKTHALSLTSISFSSFIGPWGQGEQEQMALGVGYFTVCVCKATINLKVFLFFFSFHSCNLASGINPDVKWPLIEFDIATFLNFFFESGLLIILDKTFSSGNSKNYPVPSSRQVWKAGWSMFIWHSAIPRACRTL